MGVQKDSGELLLFFYDALVNKGKDQIGTQEVIDETKWESKRINNAYNYLRDLGVLKEELFLGNTKGVLNFIVLRLFPQGVNIVENQPEFRRNFGFEVNLGLLKFNWGATEK